MELKKPHTDGQSHTLSRLTGTRDIDSGDTMLRRFLGQGRTLGRCARRALGSKASPAETWVRSSPAPGVATFRQMGMVISQQNKIYFHA